MDPMTIGMIITAAISAAKTMKEKKEKAKGLDVQAVTQRWSPWTGMEAPTPKNVDAMGNLLQSGAMVGAVGKGIGAWGGQAAAAAPKAATKPGFASDGSKIVIAKPGNKQVYASLEDQNGEQDMLQKFLKVWGG